MQKLRNNNSGYTLVEVLVSVGILLVFVPFAANMLINSNLLASFDRHKLQAAYAAQEILETERQAPFVSLAAGASQTIGPNSVLLDTKGNYNNTSCATITVFCGTTVITVTPAVYTNSVGVQATNTNVDHYLLKIYWNEKVLGVLVPITEYFAEDVVNDTMLN